MLPTAQGVIACTTRRVRRARAAAVRIGAWALAVSLCVAHLASAQEPSASTDEVAPATEAAAAIDTTAPVPGPSADDAEAREAAREILSRDIFQDVEARRRRELGIGQLLERLFQWLIELFGDDADQSSPIAAPSLPLPGPTFFIVLGVAFAVAAAAFLLLNRSRDEELVARAAGAIEAVPDPRDRAPDDWLAEASALAAAGRFREALRALYLATLVALDRRAWIRFEASLTNWQYLRQMPDGEAREDFRALTRTFDVKFYGGEAASSEDYARGRTLVERILRLSRPSLPPPPAPQGGEDTAS